MTPQELRAKKEGDLAKMLLEEREHLRDLTFRLSGAQLKNSHELSVTKKKIARILTILNERRKQAA